MIRYIKDMKYVLASDYEVQTPIIGNPITDDWFILSDDGKLWIRRGFPWNGASGPTWDTDSCISASAVHDVFCVCMRDGRLDFDKWQDKVNEFFREMCVANGMSSFRAKLWHMGVEFGGAGNPEQGPDRPVMEAP